MFIIRLFSGRRVQLARSEKKLRDPAVREAFKHLSKVIRGQGSECNTPEHIADLPGGTGWDFVLKVFPHGSSWDTHTYRVQRVDGAFSVSRQQ